MGKEERKKKRQEKKERREENREERQDRRREWMYKAKNKFNEWNENGLLDELMVVVDAIQNPSAAVFTIIDKAIPGEQPYLEKIEKYIAYIENAIGDPIGTAIQMIDYAIPGDNPLLEAALNVTAFMDPQAIAAIAVEAATGLDIPGMGLDEFQNTVIDPIKQFIEDGPNLGGLTDNGNDNEDITERDVDFQFFYPNEGDEHTKDIYANDDITNENTDNEIINRGGDFLFSESDPTTEEPQETTTRGSLFSEHDPTITELQEATTRDINFGDTQNNDHYNDNRNYSNNGSPLDNGTGSIPDNVNRALFNIDSNKYTLPSETGNITCNPDCYSQCDCKHKELKRRCDLITKDFVASMKQKGCNTSCYNKTTKRICR